MYINNQILIAKNDKKELAILPRLVNRHGIITGASGSGKTTTVKVLSESMSAAGIPVFFVDVKGDLASIAKPGSPGVDFIDKRVNELGLSEEGFTFQGFPVTFFDVFKKNGHPIRTTLSDIGPRLLSRMLSLSDSQEGNLAIAFQIAQDENMKLNDLGDLRSLLNYVADNRNDYITKYGNITSQSIATIQRNILMLQQEGGDNFFGKPELQLFDLLQYDMNGKGFINILDAQELFKKPTLYACFLIWLLNYLYDNCPEVGDLDRPKLALFLDEAHIIFNEMSPELIKNITQIVKLIRSKGIGVYFISQSPSDIPEEILSQLGNKVQHVLRSYTPSDEKAVKAAANSFRTNPLFNTAEEIKSLATGEALVSFLNENGEPEIVERAFILPPQSLNGTLSDGERQQIINSSRIYGKYENVNDEYSAAEIVTEANKKKDEEKQAELDAIAAEKQRIADEKAAEKARKEEEKAAKEAEREAAKKKREEEKAEREAERERKNSVGYKLGKKVVNKTTDKVINKGLNSLFKNLFK